VSRFGGDVLVIRTVADLTVDEEVKRRTQARRRGHEPSRVEEAMLADTVF